jgi:hypothetical protein
MDCLSITKKRDADKYRLFPPTSTRFHRRETGKVPGKSSREKFRGKVPEQIIGAGKVPEQIIVSGCGKVPWKSSRGKVPE